MTTTYPPRGNVVATHDNAAATPVPSIETVIPRSRTSTCSASAFPPTAAEEIGRGLSHRFRACAGLSRSGVVRGESYRISFGRSTLPYAMAL